MDGLANRDQVFKSIIPCAVCQEGIAEMACGCQDRPLALCPQCVPNHYETSLAEHRLLSLSEPLHRHGKPGICSICDLHNAFEICLSCAIPLITLCRDCKSRHELDSPAKPHVYASLEAAQHVENEGHLRILENRVLNVKHMKKALEDNFTQLSVAEQEVKRYFEALAQIVIKNQAFYLSQIQALKEQLTDAISQLLYEMKDHLYEPEYCLSVPQLSTVWNSPEKPSFQLFSFNTDLEAVSTALFRSITLEMGVSMPLENIIPVLNRHQLRKFDTKSEKWLSPVALSETIQIDEFSVWLEINGFLFCCGGFKPLSSTVYMIEAKCGKVETIRPMRQARSSQGMALYGSEIYVFGGFAQREMKQCEMFDFELQDWQQLPNMKYERFAFTPCTLDNLIYLSAGTPSSNVEVFNPRSHSFTELQILVSDVGKSTSLIVNEELVLVQKFGFQCWKLGGEFRWVSANTWCGWSNCPPVQTHSGVFVFTGENNCISKLKFPEMKAERVFAACFEE